jgi:putative tryptophan/tyrosine transport system substrate-binding protein
MATSIRRRKFITLLGGAMATWPLAAHAQQPERMRRIGALFVGTEDDAEVKQQVARFQEELAKLGWVEGRTIQIDYRFGADKVDQYPTLAKELVGLQPEVIVTQTTPVTAALQRETRTIPIVFTRVSDPVASGFVSSLARPGSNITGLLQYEAGITGKWLAMLKEIAPRLKSVAFIASQGTLVTYNYFLQSAKAVAPSLTIEVVPSPISNAGDIERSIIAFARVTDGGLLVVPDVINLAHRDFIIALAARYRLPAVYPWRFFVAAGGLMSYGIDDVDLLRDAASYVDRILRGAKPADLPVQAPTKFQTVVNLKTAKALGIDVPPSLLVRADEVIE